ncbi:MAG: 4Fe-4S binding protein [Bacilli bacterium]|nr:4Fe-4S binding protein [Bacilli bacterium]
MGKVKEFFLKIKPSRRRIIQLYAALLTNANLKGYITGKFYKGPLKSVCTPGLNCYSCPGATGACPIGSLQATLADENKKTVMYVLGIILLYAIIFGRTICGYICPTGLIQDLLYKIKTPKLKKNKVTYVLSYLKYFILALLVIGVPLALSMTAKGTPLPAFCKYICPAGTLGGGVLLLGNANNVSKFEMLGGLFTWKFALAVVLVVAAIFIYRVFCRFLCPLGALYGLFNKLSILGIHVNKSTCTHCNACVSHCKMDVKVVGDHECINCGECKTVCASNSISFGGEDIVQYFHRRKAEDLANAKIAESPEQITIVNEEQTLPVKNKPSKKKLSKKAITNIAIFVPLTALTVGTLIYVNFFEKKVSDEPTEGYRVGDLCVSKELKLINGEEGTWKIEDWRGKISVINFWGTWCTPCVDELPEFDEVYKEYSTDVEVIAIHQGSKLYPENKVNSFIQNRWSDFTIHFAMDDVDDQYFYKLGGLEDWPITTIVDQEGIIRYTHDGAISKSVLVSEIESLKQ